MYLDSGQSIGVVVRPLQTVYYWVPSMYPPITHLQNRASSDMIV